LISEIISGNRQGLTHIHDVITSPYFLIKQEKQDTDVSSCIHLNCGLSVHYYSKEWIR